MGRKKRRGPEEMVDKAVGGLSEATGRVAGDRSLEAEGQALRTKGKMKTCLVKPHAEEKKGWKVEAEGARRASSVHRTKPEAVAAAKELARRRAPSQVLVYKQDGLTVQEEKTYR
jgi:uncharacterized protein YjbJ (UPF0337 family)